MGLSRNLQITLLTGSVNWISYWLADNCVICMSSLRCRLLQYAVFVGMAKKSSKNFFDLFCFQAMASRFLSSSEDEIRQLLEETPKTQKEHTKSLSKCFRNTCWKRGLQSRPKKAKLLGF